MRLSLSESASIAGSAARRSPKEWIARLSSRWVLAIRSKVPERRKRIASSAPSSIEFSSRLIGSKVICSSLALGSADNIGNFLLLQTALQTPRRLHRAEGDGQH